MAILKFEKLKIEKSMQTAVVPTQYTGKSFTFSYIVAYEEVEKEDYKTKEKIIEKRYFILKVNQQEKDLFDRVRALNHENEIFNVECDANGSRSIPQKESIFADYHIKSFNLVDIEKIEDTIPF